MQRLASASAIIALAFSVIAGVTIVAPARAAQTANAPSVANAEAPPPGNASTLQPGDRVPNFTARSLETGKQLTPADFAGKVLVVNFWATWCPPCRAETPDMVRAYHRLRANDVAFLGIDTTEVPSVIKTFLSAKDVPYPVALGGPAAYNGFGVAYIPTTVVVDPHGIVRARWTGQIAEDRLAQFVADARAGKSYILDTPDQRRVEALLDPSGYHFDGDPSEVKAEIARARASIATSEQLAVTHGVGKDATIDYARVQTLQGALLLPAARAALRLASTPKEHVAADRMIAAADGNLNRFADAVAALHDAQEADPSDTSLWLDIAKAYYRLHDYDAEIAAAAAYTKAVPDDSDGWDALALANQRKKNFAAAAPLYEHTLELLRAAVDAAKTPSDKVDAIANVADESLDLADVYVALGDEAGAARTFAQANTYGNQLDPNGPYANLYRNVHERTQEGLVAVRIAHGTGTTALSIVPWTGPDLPGSIASTLKYRLIVAKAPNAKVDLTALGLLPGWVASFCADGLCSPNRVSVVLPDSGVKTYEFQLIPPGSSRAPGTVRVSTSDGVVTDVPSAVALGAK